MDSTTTIAESNEPSVDEGAFWHTNMDLYYGYLQGEVVEVEHESHKYWLATIQYCYKHLLLLKWVGNYDEFWIDTSISNTTTNSCGPSNELNVPKRVFPLGYHLQSQLKSQFTLEKPSKILIKPSLYNPSKDPYAEIRTVDDLLAYEVDDQNNDDAFVDKSTSETAGHVLAKCKTKINYKQEDVDELEAALQNLNDMDYNESKGPTESPDNQMSIFGNSDKQGDSKSSVKNEKDSSDDLVGACKDSGVDSDISNQRPSSSPDRRMNEILKDEDDMPKGDQAKVDCGVDPKHDQICLDLCKQLQTSAINKGRYMGIHLAGNEQTDDVYFLKPKQFFDVGGANHERLFVPGTILEISYTKENSEGYLDIFHWFAFTVKNIGGRLTLRWFICDEPKFKQGRLEMKSCRSKFVVEDVDPPADTNNGTSNLENGIKIIEDAASLGASKHIPVKSITFSKHFCDPIIHKIGHAKSVGREYKMPDKIFDYIEETHGQDYATKFVETQLSHIHDARRMYLDKDRPLIDHMLTVVRNRSPNYLDLVFAPKDKTSRREVLISCPKMTKLLKASVKRELEPGIFELHSEPLQENGEIIKFIYPYDSSYSILPLDWAINNEDCLSISPSRNPSPIISDQSENNPADNDGQSKEDTMKSDTKDTATTTTTTTIVQTTKVKVEIDENGEDELSQQKAESTELGKDHVIVEQCLKSSRSSFPRPGGPFTKISEAVKADIPELQSIPDFDEFNPSCWSEVLRSKEMNAPLFHCCIDYSLKEEVESKFKVMDQLEIVHPSSDSIICSGRIRKVVFPLLWIQLSSDCYTLVPFNLTDMYPTRWCETYNHPIISLLPPRKRCNETSSASQSDIKRRKKAKIPEQNDKRETNKNLVSSGFKQLYEKEHFDLGALNDRQSGIDYILDEKSAYVKIYFNHKCFTGPSLSKSKICSLPQYVGPGPMRLVLEEVVTKVISVAYVPPRILNDLSSKSFEELLIERNLTNTSPMEFKAKYQKRVHRETIPVCLNPDDVAFYCECICEHIKCCYNLFGPNLYDGDDCPSHCRSLTKSNKFMKRATYYREKARQGEYLSNVNNVCSKFTNPEDWSVEEVGQYLDWCQLSIFKPNIKSEGIDGQALLLLDRAAIKEHFQRHAKSEFTPEEVDKLCRFVELVRTRAETTGCSR